MTAPTFNALIQPTNTVSAAAPAGFCTATGYVLAQCCNLSYTQYSQYPTALPATGTFANGESYSMIGAPFTTSESIGTGSEPGKQGDYRTIPVGFAMQVSVGGTASYNVVCLRGTRTYSEWLSDATAVPSPFRVGNNGGKYYHLISAETAILGSVHGGFLSLYTVGTDGAQPVKTDHWDGSEYSRPAGSVAQQVYDTLTGSGIDTSLPLYVTGHSLGAALAVICAMDIGTNMAGTYQSGGLSMVNFAGPLVAAGIELDSISVPPFGSVSTFVSAYGKAVNNSWRVVNAADLVPILPPAAVDLETISIDFAHVTEQTVTYGNQTGSIGGNHSLTNNYLLYMAGLAGGFS